MIGAITAIVEITAVVGGLFMLMILFMFLVFAFLTLLDFMS